MPNPKLFSTTRPLTVADTVNEAGGKAIKMSPKHALAQYATTGCFNDTYYIDAKQQLDTLLQLCAECDPLYVAKAAVYARRRGRMKDAPALMLAHLSTRDDKKPFKFAFFHVVDNVKQLRTFVQFMRSGVVGRRSLGSKGPRKMIRLFLDFKPPDQLFYQSIGDKPSLGDIIKMVHHRPCGSSPLAAHIRSNFNLYMARGQFVYPNAPLVEAYEAYKASKLPGTTTTEFANPPPVPDVDFRMLDSLGLTNGEWAEVAKRCSWQTLRMNLNTFARHGVFNIEGMTAHICRRLTDPDAIEKSGVFPYQLLMAFLATENVPPLVSIALQEAMEFATRNVPAIPGQLVVCPDTSGSMQSAITGKREGATSKMTCVQVAALFAATLLRRNPGAIVMPFDTEVRMVKLNPLDTIMTNAAKLSLNGGGTDCAAPLRVLKTLGRGKVDAVIFISDYESWFDRPMGPYWSGGFASTQMESEWNDLQRLNPGCKLVCIDITPNTSVQVKDRPNVLNVGGFSDAVFDAANDFISGRYGPDYWVSVIEAEPVG